MIVVPMAGLSRRFTEAGYTLPKYMLEARGATLFDHAVESFAAYYSSQPFLFVVRDVAGTPAFVAARCAALRIADPRIVVLSAETRGQAETVAIGLREGGGDPAEAATIFNIDTFRPGFRFPDFTEQADGYLETFVGEGANWSFARPVTEGSDRVAETAEKRPISRFCCTGLYHFARAGDFLAAFDAESERPPAEWDARELYVAPLYNRLIAAGRDIRLTVIPRDEVIFCGVPDEYRAFQGEPPTP